MTTVKVKTVETLTLLEGAKLDEAIRDIEKLTVPSGGTFARRRLSRHVA